MARTTSEPPPSKLPYHTNPVSRPYRGCVGREGCVPCSAPAGGRLASKYDLACHRPHAHLQWNWVSNLESSSPESLPLGHIGLNEIDK
ncbi:hypothetical protein AVEN_181351-1 [Araneus ventricosus]|uniref:Uncharacterized protein n=1 Tax=Araneus ventricosus TaxID=182803 RepID=A0A4Y2NWF3_ARAVE|nr:hypothetical protein AVEN_147528-1 [Araneus ventricosus]GBN42287.1 hypothetical protein AVEN_181351-1 [Araneus ventricosus]